MPSGQFSRVRGEPMKVSAQTDVPKPEALTGFPPSLAWRRDKTGHSAKLGLGNIEQN